MRALALVHPGTVATPASDGAVIHAAMTFLEARGYAIELAPPIVPSLPMRERDVYLRKALPSFDAFLTTPAFPDPFLHAKRPRGVYVPLGELPREANVSRAIATSTMRDDSWLVTCRGDLAVLQALYNDFPPEVKLLTPSAHAATRDQSTEQLRHSLLASDRQPERLVVYCGRVMPEKNVLEAASAVLEASERCGVTVRMVIAGPFVPALPHDVETEGNAYTYLSDLVRTVSSEPSLLHIGELPHSSALALLMAADVVVNLSTHRDENFGFAQWEAASSGTSVITTHWGGLADVSLSYSNASTVPALASGWGVSPDHASAVEAIVGALAEPRHAKAPSAAEPECLPRKLGHWRRRRVAAELSTFGARLNALVPPWTPEDSVTAAAFDPVQRFKYQHDDAWAIKRLAVAYGATDVSRPRPVSDLRVSDGLVLDDNMACAGGSVWSKPFPVTDQQQLILRALMRRPRKMMTFPDAAFDDIHFLAGIGLVTAHDDEVATP